jgi:hypothetical protein
MAAPQSEIHYEEKWSVPFAPIVFFLPMFYKYNVIVSNDTLTFGYGFNQPFGLTTQNIPLKSIDTDSIKIGSASWKDNLLTFGGWGIRLGLNGTTAYNAKNGNYIEFVTEKNRKFRFVSNDVETVASLLRGENVSQRQSQKDIKPMY